MKFEELKSFLDEKYIYYNNQHFIKEDPVSIPHVFSTNYDIEIAGFISATLAWGQRKTIINKSKQLIGMMDNAPYEFLRNAKEKDFNQLKVFKHRTFNGTDCLYFIRALSEIYKNQDGIGGFFEKEYRINKNIVSVIKKFREYFFSFQPQQRTYKHFADISAGSTGKRINMFLRWMIRQEGPVDFGIWKSISPSVLFMPLDIHTSRVSRSLGLLKRNQNDWKAVCELTNNLQKLDASDPVKYDYALFGLGKYENF